jgi:hypothetical protein
VPVLRSLLLLLAQAPVLRSLLLLLAQAPLLVP